MTAEFGDVIAALNDDLKKIDKIILSFARGKSPLIQEISNHLIASGGKRVRPILLLLSAQLCGSENDDRHNLAAAVELIHSATLLHDDVVDVSEIRRGKKTANAIWDNKVSILVGDYLFSIAFQLMVFSKNLHILNLLAQASSIMADGEVMQLQNSNDIALSQDKYLEIIFGKTAVLFSAACECGALLNQRSQDEIIALREFGKALGIIFQIIDDILDYSAEEETLGKEIGNDFFEGKVTLPIILTYEAASESEKKFIAEIFQNNLIAAEKNQDDFKKILALMKKNNGLKAAQELAFQYCDQALKNLEIFPESKAKADLIILLNHSLSRVS